MRPKIFLLFSITMLTISCYKEKYEGKIAYNQEIILGKYLDSILTNNFNIIDTTNYIYANSIYNFLDSLINKITLSQEIMLTANKKYCCRIIIDTSINILNLPCNYIYITTGLLKTIENTAQLAGGLAHFISHNDRRHQMDNLEKCYGINLILKAISGNKILLEDISNKIVSNHELLKYSEDQEKEAIKYGIYYLSTTNYDILEIINFEKLLLKSESLKKFHPYNDKEKLINDTYNQIGMPEGNKDKIQYNNFKSLLP